MLVHLFDELFCNKDIKQHINIFHFPLPACEMAWKEWEQQWESNKPSSLKNTVDSQQKTRTSKIIMHKKAKI